MAKTNEELIAEFNHLHTASIALQSGMMTGNNTDKECLDSYERLEQFFAEALTQKDAEVAEAVKAERERILRIVNTIPRNGSVTVAAYPPMEFAVAHNNGYKQLRERVVKALTPPPKDTLTKDNL